MSDPATLSFAATNPEELTIEHQAEVNPLTGTAVVHVALDLTSGRANFGPQLSLEYDSSSGNSPYGLGWSLGGLLMIAVNTRKTLPRYEGKDNFVFSGSGELVPVLRLQTGQWQPIVVDRGNFWVRYFRGKVATSQIRVEQWTQKATNRVHWRTRDVRNVLTIYGLSTGDEGHCRSCGSRAHVCLAARVAI